MTAALASGTSVSFSGATLDNATTGAVDVSASLVFGPIATLSANLSAQINKGTSMYVLGGIEDLIINRWNSSEASSNSLFTGDASGNRVITEITTTIGSTANHLSRYLRKKTVDGTAARPSVTSGYVSKYTLNIKQGTGVNSVNVATPTGTQNQKDQAIINLDSIANIAVGMTVTGHANIPTLAKVKSISGTTVTLTVNITTDTIPDDTGLKFMGDVWWDYKDDVTNGDLTTFKGALDQVAGSNTGGISKDALTNFRIYFFPTSETVLDGAASASQKVLKVKKNSGNEGYANIKVGDTIVGSDYGTNNTVASIASDGVTITLTNDISSTVSDGTAVVFNSTNTLTVADITTDVSNLVSHVYYSGTIHNPEQMKNVVDLAKNSNFTFALAETTATERKNTIKQPHNKRARLQKHPEHPNPQAQTPTYNTIFTTEKQTSHKSDGK